MKIGLNATCLNDRPSGARQRFIGIYGELVKRMPDAQFVVYEPSNCRVADWFGGASNVSARRTLLPSEGRTKRFIAGLRYWRSALAGERFDVFEGFNLPFIKAPTGRNVLTIHDLRTLQSGAGALDRAVFRAVLQASLAAADQVVAVSEAVKQEILKVHSDARVAVVYNGLDTSKLAPLPRSVVEEARGRLALPHGFLLAVGHFEARKNYPRLIDAMARLRDRGRERSLVIIGNDSGERRLVEDRIRDHGLTGSVKVLSGLSDEEVRCAYQLSDALVFPSTYEGFGIPILEAMAAGCPMALSDIPVFREITQDQGLYFSPHDPESMATAIEAVMAPEGRRAGLVEYGRWRVKDFDFQPLAGQVEALYLSLVAGERGMITGTV